VRTVGVSAEIRTGHRSNTTDNALRREPALSTASYRNIHFTTGYDSNFFLNNRFKPAHNGQIVPVRFSPPKLRGGFRRNTVFCTE
jgi:hypothetical protein